MKAIVISSYGGPEVLHLEEVPTPEPGAGEVLVKVISTSVNPVDYKLRNGDMKARVTLPFPAILGRDVAGEVAKLGPGVTQWKVGDSVLGFVNSSYAEFLVAKAATLASAPEGIDLKTAGRLPVVVLTGSQLIENGVQPQPGDTVLVTGALGSVGRSAVYVAKQHGAHVIAGVRKSQLDAAASLGADNLVALDDDEALPNLGPFDELANTVGGETILKLLPKWTGKGKLSSVVGLPESVPKSGVTVGILYGKPDPHRLNQLAADVMRDRFAIPVAAVLPLSEIQEAHRLAASGAAGKIVLQPS